MERRFHAALLSAVALHAVLMGLSALWANRGTLEAALVPKANEVEVSLTVDDGPRSPSVTESSSGQATSAHSKPAARGASSFRSAASGPVHTEAEASEDLVAEATAGEPLDSSSDQAPGAPGGTPRPQIDLGLDGSIVAHALRATEERDVGPRALRRRPALLFDAWSESVVSKVAHTTALGEGSALLTIEWDANGRLVSVRSSAESANANAWGKLAATLQRQLAQRPQASSRGMRLVYLVKAEVVKPGKRSMLPESSNVSVQTFRDEQLPPANILMLGVRADTSPASQRVVSVTLANSQLL